MKKPDNLSLLNMNDKLIQNLLNARNELVKAIKKQKNSESIFISNSDNIDDEKLSSLIWAYDNGLIMKDCPKLYELMDSHNAYMVDHRYVYGGYFGSFRTKKQRESYLEGLNLDEEGLRDVDKFDLIKSKGPITDYLDEFIEYSKENFIILCVSSYDGDFYYYKG